MFDGLEQARPVTRRQSQKHLTEVAQDRAHAAKILPHESVVDHGPKVPHVVVMLIEPVERDDCLLVQGAKLSEVGGLKSGHRRLCNGLLPNGSRLSCGRPARRRKSVGRQSAPTRAQILRFP